MELDWSTVVLEMVNFVVLVWLLHRLLYRPVLNVIAQRRAAIEAQTAAARRANEEAAALRAQYDGRLKAWEEERTQARGGLAGEIQAERTQRLAELQTTLDQEREKARVVEERRRREEARATEARAVAQSAHFVAKLLARIADAPLELKLATAALDDLRAWPDTEHRRMREALENGVGEVIITSAFPLAEPHRQMIVDRLSDVLGRTPHCTWREDPELLAGLRISIGPLVLSANLHDELRFFTGVASPDAVASTQ